MLFSRNSFFKKEKGTLRIKLRLLLEVLKDAQVKDIERFKLAYDYFTYFPEDFDGATIVKDLDTIRDLDAPAMVHDYEYLVNKVWKNPINKFKADLRYAQDIEKLGNSSLTAYFRFILLVLSTPFYYIIKLFK